MPLDPLIIAGAIQAAGSVASGIGANKRQKRQRQWALDDWERVNKYNHPQAQMQRLSEAKLNPNLIYGKGAGAANTAGSIGQTDLSTSPEEQIGAGAGAIATNYFDQKLKTAQTADQQQSAAKKAAETVNIGVKTDTDKENLKIIKEFAFENAWHAQRKLEADADTTIGRENQNRRLDKTRVSREKAQTEITQIEAKLRRNGLTPNSPDYLKLMVLNKSELEKLINYLK